MPWFKDGLFFGWNLVRQLRLLQLIIGDVRDSPMGEINQRTTRATVQSCSLLRWMNWHYNANYDVRVVLANGLKGRFSVAVIRH